MRDFVLGLRKAELHVHLEGSVELSLLRELAGDVPADLYTYRNFADFLEAYKYVNRRLRGPADYALAARRLLARLAEENVQYAEIILSVGVILWKQQNVGEIFEALQEEAAEQNRVRVAWIFDAIRHFGVDHATQVAELAVEHRGGGVVGFGIGGDEERGPCRQFRPVFQYVREHGLAILPHAGETTDAEAVWQAVEAGADRIGHGIRAQEDPALVRYLRDMQIPLEICISSNVATGAVSGMSAHPVRALFDAGVPIVLNTDDPAMFHTTLVKEYTIAAHEFGFTREELAKIAENSFRFARIATIANSCE